MSLQFQVACAVTDERGQLLLTGRDDLGAWGLPVAYPHGDAALPDVAARAVHNASHISTRIQRAVGLYFWPGLSSLTLVAAGQALGDTLRGHSAFFQPDALPEMPSHQALMALDALAGTRHRPRVFDLSSAEQQRLRFGQTIRKLRGRLRGQNAAPELDVQAVGIVMDELHQRVLTLKRKRTEALPRLVCSGQRPPWDELASLVQAEARVPVTFRWVGAWQDRHKIDLVFAATATETFDLPGQAEWSLARQVALPGREANYLNRVKPSFARDAIWMIQQDTPVQSGDTIFRIEERER
jgi:hypothetical protein